MQNLNPLNDNNVVDINEYKLEVFKLKMLRAKDLSEIFVGTSQATYNKWFKSGLLPRYKICGGVYYKLSEVEALIENSREYKEVV